jgi:hypothetical protein
MDEREVQPGADDETCRCCGSPMRDSDHCPFCGCEWAQSFCAMVWDGMSRWFGERD